MRNSSGRFLPFLSGPIRQAAIRSLREFHNSGSGIFAATKSLEDDNYYNKSVNIEVEHNIVYRNTGVQRITNKTKPAKKILDKVNLT